MTRTPSKWKLLLVGSVFAAGCPALVTTAEAAAKSHGREGGAKHAQSMPTIYRGSAPTSYRGSAELSRISFHAAGLPGHFSSKHAFSKNAKFRYGPHYAGSYGGGYGGGSLQCVPFARAASGIELKGNAANWWYAAEGVYERGNHPEPGSVLNFRATGGMRLGHVAVVTAVLGTRQIEIEHANWAGPGASKGGISRGIPVVDVSPANDWSEVRVGLGNSGEYGSDYPTYGFIYDRPDSGTMVASNGGSRTFNTAYVSSGADDEEVAEAPSPRHQVVHLHKTTSHKSKSKR